MQIKKINRIKISGNSYTTMNLETKDPKDMEDFIMNKPVLVIMAAGMGSRYGGLKQIDPVDQ